MFYGGWIFECLFVVLCVGVVRSVVMRFLCNFVVLVVGLLFGFGLIVLGMVDLVKVLGFLDLVG